MKQKGQSLVEIILVMGLSVIIFPALLTGLVSSRQGKAQQTQRTQAVYLLNETTDAIRSVREKGWALFAVDGTYHTATSSGSWALATGSATLNGLTQSIVIGDVRRAASGEVVASGGTLDPSSKKVDITISWSQPYSSAINATLYMTRYLDNNSFTHTTVSDFTGVSGNMSILSGATISNTSGGEITLGAGGHGNWCAPNLSLAVLDLPKSGVANAVSAIEGRVFAGTGDNAAGVSFANVNIATTYPPVASIAGTFDGYKTNAVFGEQNFAYLGTDNNFKEVVIIDLTQFSDPPTNSKYKEVGSINLEGSINANNIYVTNNKAYILSSNKQLYIYDITTRAKNYGVNDYVGKVALSGQGKKVLVTGNYAYVATDATSNQFQIIDISNSSSPTIVNSPGLTLGTSQSGVDVYVNTSISNPDKAYFVTSYSSGKPNFFVIDISSKSAPHLPTGYVGYNTNGMSPKGLTAVTNNKVIVVGAGGEEYQAIDLSTDPLNPTRCGGLNIDTGINGIAYVIQANGDVFSYIITGDAGSEFKIIEGGPGGSYVPAGDFTSSTFDPGYSTAFNRFDVSVNRPNSTNIQFQVSVKQAAGTPLTCSGVAFSASDFVGPNGTSSDKFQTAITSGTQIFNYVVPFGINPGQCFKYKAFLSTSDPTSDPIFYDITVNYSP